MRILYYVHGHGRGHSRRALSVLPLLQEMGAEVEVFAGGSAKDLLDGQAALHDRTIVAPGPSALARIGAMAAQDARTLREVKPDWVIADGDQASVLGARMAGIPVLAIGHDLTFTCGQMPSGLPTRSLAHQTMNGAIPTWFSTAQIAVHFLPLESKRPTATCARPNVPPELCVQPEREDFILAYFRDPNGADVVEALAAMGHQVKVFGHRLSTTSSRVQQCSFDRGLFADALTRARAVVSSAGSNVLSECMLTETPVFGLYADGDHEQALNGALLNQADAGMSRRMRTLSRKHLEEFMSRAQGGEFTSVQLEQRMPPLTECVRNVLLGNALENAA